MTCQQVLRAEGKAYPRTCADCGLGPCNDGKGQYYILPLIIECSPANIATESSTSELRFVERDGKRILQQAWSVVSTNPSDRRFEWRDIPLVAES